MIIRLFQITLAVTTVTFFLNASAQENDQPEALPDENDWAATEYSGVRTKRDIQTAFASKGFTWLSGSPADNEKLSIGKNAQFFGFVALRYQSGRAAHRGALGRAFFAIADEEQRKLLADAVLAEDESLKDWWDTRETILRMYENHLYTGQPIDEEKAAAIGEEFSQLAATVAIHEARGYAALEDTLSDTQRAQIIAWRADPEKVLDTAKSVRVTSEVLEPSQSKQLEDLFAKAFSWITGTSEDNEIIPLGQPAQFFGFVSIRHKSGHGANRGQIAKSFNAILNAEQLAVIDMAADAQIPVVHQFLEQRRGFLQQLALLRTQPNAFDEQIAMEFATRMGALEIEAGWIEAKAYRKIRETMADEQLSQMMKLRGEYVLDESQMESLSTLERGAQLAILCSGCHAVPGQNRPAITGPTLHAIFDRPIASTEGFEYSNAMRKLRDGGPWTPEGMNEFLAEPKAFLPGTKMEFQGLLNAEDREALIEYLEQTL